MDNLCIDASKVLHYLLCIRKVDQEKDTIVYENKILDDYCIIEEYMCDVKYKKKLD